MLSPYCVTLVSCLIIHFQIFSSYSIFNSNQPVFFFASIILGLSNLLYPLCGWITEVCGNNFRMIRWSFLVMLIATILMSIPLFGVIKQHGGGQMSILDITSGTLSVIVFTTALGMYEANAIQYGMDQMMDASSEQLSSFIHWYYWCANFGPLLGSCIIIGSSAVKAEAGFISPHKSNVYISVISLVVLCVQTFTLLAGFLLTSCAKRFLMVEQISRNSLKIIYKVLLYSYHHKYPERRSAFTYWENDIPSRIDLGKEKYGGPFTYEQVEDVKTFFRLLLLIVSLFGFHLLGDGYSLSSYIVCNFGCPQTEQLLSIVTNTQHIPMIVVLICIPILECVRKYSPSLYFFLPNMLTRKWIGLFVALLAQTLTVIIYTFPPASQQSLYDQPICSRLQVISEKTSLIQTCLKVNSDMNKLTHKMNDSLSTMVYITIILLVLQGITYILIFMTTLEFICAQATNSMKGLLIGIWYSMLSIKFLVVNNLDVHPLLLAPFSWSIYNGIKGFGIFLSIVFFCFVTKRYTYRKRNEIVNERAIIEEIHERELLLNVSIESYNGINNS